MLTVAYIANAKHGGISTLTLNRTKGTLSQITQTMPECAIAPLTTNPNKQFLYAAIRSNTPELATFLIDSETAEPHLINRIQSPASTTHLTVDATGRFLLGVSYSENLVFVMAIGKEGLLQKEPVCTLKPGRNPHCIRLDASNRFAFIPLLGNDVVAQYLFNQHTGALTQNHPAFVATERESGPRHLDFSPDSRFAYLLTEMGGEIVSFGVHRENGTLGTLHAVSMLPENKRLPKGSYTPPVNSTGGPNSKSPVMWGAEIRVTPDGKFLFASERTNSTISSFAVDPVSGRIDLREVVETEAQPRGFAVEPFGKFVLVAGEKSGCVSAYAIGDEGELVCTDRREVGENPIWIETVVL